MVHFVAIEGSTGNNLSMQQVIECNTFDISLDSEDVTHTHTICCLLDYLDRDGSCAHFPRAIESTRSWFATATRPLHTAMFPLHM